MLLLFSTFGALLSIHSPFLPSLDLHWHRSVGQPNFLDALCAHYFEAVFSITCSKLWNDPDGFSTRGFKITFFDRSFASKFIFMILTISLEVWRSRFFHVHWHILSSAMTSDQKSQVMLLLSKIFAEYYQLVKKKLYDGN